MAVEIVQRCAANDEFYKSTACRPLRKAIQPLVAAQRKQMYSGGSHTEYVSKKNARKEAKGRKAKQREQDLAYINKAALRAERMRNLSKLQSGDGGAELPRIADGAASTSQPMLESAAANEAAGPAGGEDEEGLHSPRACYVCKKRFRKLHHFYDLLCPPCASVNWEKRHQAADLTGMVALVTGGRVKIGFEVVLKLLRAGARVVVTTRFPNDCARRFSRQADSSEWLSRLEVFGLDLRDLASVKQFCDHFSQAYGTLQILVHNACQTIRRPAAFYRSLVPGERASLGQLPEAIRPVVKR